jgi:predicted HicB family RNase H-like nuclease
MYFVNVRFDAQTEQFCAGAPELDLQVIAPSREEAMSQLDAVIQDFLAESENVPEPRDAEKAENKLELEISATLSRELTFFARSEGVSVSQLAQELLAEALFRRTGLSRGGYQGGQAKRRDNRGGNRPDGRGVSRERYHDIMENKASFLEYVRGLENGRPPKK